MCEEVASLSSCARCKSCVSKSWKFCNNCGSNLTIAIASSASSSVPSSLPSSLPTKKSKKVAIDFIDKVKHDKYLNRSTYSSITINNKKHNNYDANDDDIDNDDDNDDNTLNIDQNVLKAIDDRINSLNSDTYKMYKKKMILAEMLADELEMKNAEFVESSYRQIVDEYQSNDDAEMLNDFVV